MRNIIGVLLHLGQVIAHNLAILILSNVGELGPREAMIEVVLHLGVLGQAEQVAVPHGHQGMGPSMAEVHIGSR